MMKAVGFSKSLPVSDEQSLLDLSVPQPVPGPHDILVQVRAISVNPVDYKVRQRMPPPEGESKILGYDAAGTVLALGPEVTRFREGDEVYYSGSIARPGTNSEYHVVDERIAGPKPRTLDFAQAAALPLTTITAWELLFDRLAVQPDEKKTLLVVGGGGGVGSILIQLARQLTSLYIIATASREETRNWCLEMGADEVVDHSNPLDVMMGEARLNSIDYIASLTATGEHWGALCKLLRPQGKIGVIDDPESVLDISLLKRKSASFHWEFMFARPVFNTPDIAEQHRILRECATLVDDGKIRSTLAKNLGRINAENIRNAHALLESGTTRGKIVLEGF